MNKQKPAGLVKKVGLGLLAVGLVVAVAYFAVVRPLQIRHQKQQFARAEAGLDQLYNQIVAKVGKPDQYKKERSCSRAHLKSERGPLGCDVTLSALYLNRTVNEANRLMQQIVPFGLGEIRIGSGSASGTQFRSTETSKGTQTFYLSIETSTYLSCAFGFNYPAQDRGTFSKANEYSYQLDISCGGPAMAEFYPVKN